MLRARPLPLVSFSLVFFSLACSKQTAKAKAADAVACDDAVQCLAAIEALTPDRADALKPLPNTVAFRTDASVRGAYFAAARRLWPVEAVAGAARSLREDENDEVKDAAAFWLCDHGDQDGCERLGVDFGKECARQRQLTQLGFMLYRAQDDTEPAEIGYVCKGSPAELAGFAQGDVLKSIDAHPTATIARVQLHLRFAIQHLPSRFVVDRGAAETTLTVLSRVWR